jgi:Sulfotransferase family
MIVERKKSKSHRLRTVGKEDAEGPLIVVIRELVSLKSHKRSTVMQSWGLITLISAVLYLCVLVVGYFAFASDRLEGCFGFCDKLVAYTSLSHSSSGSESMDAELFSSPTHQMPQKRLLPSFANGGIIFFLHIPKTGGITVRKALQRGNGVYLLGDERRKFDKYKRDLAKYVKNGTDGKVVVFELHAANCPNFAEVSGRLHGWKSEASKNNVPFFAFTVLREPLSHALSFFNYYYGMDHGDNNFEYYETATEHDLLNTARTNPQCGFLVKGGAIINHQRLGQRVLVRECKAAYNNLLDNMDWVGSTASLSNETFPLLRSIVGSSRTDHGADHLLAENVQHKNKSPDKVVMSDLSPRTVERIRKMTYWDQKLYEATQRDYPFHQMVLVEEQIAVN